MGNASPQPWCSDGGERQTRKYEKVLSLSYNDIPYYPKICFLYLSIFPEDHLIEKMKVIQLWTAEGFINATAGKTLEEVAEDYLNELVNRSLVQVVDVGPISNPRGG